MWGPRGAWGTPPLLQVSFRSLPLAHSPHLGLSPSWALAYGTHSVAAGWEGGGDRGQCPEGPGGGGSGLLSDQEEPNAWALLGENPGMGKGAWHHCHSSRALSPHPPRHAGSDPRKPSWTSGWCRTPCSPAGASSHWERIGRWRTLPRGCPSASSGLGPHQGPRPRVSISGFFSLSTDVYSTYRVDALSLVCVLPKSITWARAGRRSAWLCSARPCKPA